jgi:hypothetical protein
LNPALLISLAVFQLNVICVDCACAANDETVTAAKARAEVIANKTPAAMREMR